MHSVISPNNEQLTSIRVLLDHITTGYDKNRTRILCISENEFEITISIGDKINFGVTHVTTQKYDNDGSSEIINSLRIDWMKTSFGVFQIPTELPPGCRDDFEDFGKLLMKIRDETRNFETNTTSTHLLGLVKRAEKDAL